MRLMISTMRDEAPFVLEWIAYHRAIGFTDFLIFSNDCQDGTDALLDRMEQMGVLIHKRNSPRGSRAVQWQALSRAIKNPMFRRAEWAMVADIDEFLNIHCGSGTLDDLIAAVPQADAFVVPWRMFGSNGRLVFNPDPVIEQFTRAAPPNLVWPLKATQIKTLFRPSPDIDQLGIHRPKLRPDVRQTWVDGNGTRVSPNIGAFLISTQDKYRLAQINHYALGSAQSFLVKVMRGRANQIRRAIDLGYWVERNFNSIEDKSILRHQSAVRKGMDSLLQDETVARLHREGIEWRQKRIAELLRDHDMFTLFNHIILSPQTPVLPLELQFQLCRLRSQAHPSRHDPEEG